jgi:hypothetical protein
MDTFASVWHERHPGLDVFLFTDQLGSHLQPAVVAKALTNGIYCRYFVANTSHFAQPLDGLPFAQLHSRLSRAVAEYVDKSIFRHEDHKAALFTATWAATRQALTRDVITAEFVRRGLFPIAPHVIRANVQLAVVGCTPTVPTAAHRAKAAALAVIGSAPNYTLPVRRVRVRKSQVYTGEELIANDEEQRRLAAEAAAKKANAKRVAADKRAAATEAQKRKRDELVVKQAESVAAKRARADEKVRIPAAGAPLGWCVTGQIFRTRFVCGQARRIEANTCRGCGVRWRSSPHWYGCSTCDAWWVCVGCRSTTSIVADHEKKCRRAK